ncbi:ADP-ribosylation factor family-domain-containing protein [Xylaria cf. heliscus]|nr:ADP-ribosylation factor family-domain-containing protein [Xylaria cf. heliscus]
MPPSVSRKRIIVCCDGTWQNADGGRAKSGADKPENRLQVPSNVTRISRCFKRICSDGVFQIIYYQSGVGSRSGILDRLFGGAFGIGISENIREAYAFICANYVDGDDIVLIGFSRGAFTARSIGGMVSDLGLLTREGMEYFYPIFKDMRNWTNEHYDDPFPTIPFTNKPKGESAASIYRERLIEKGYSRVREKNGQGSLIRVLAIGVWDTFYDTRLSNKIQHGFHALALDETRRPFTPTLWERLPQEQDTSDLRQFPGSHANIGGGWPDQGVANTTLAWMMDQLSSVGCEFKPDALERTFEANVKYYTNREPESALVKCEETCPVCPQRRNKKRIIWAEKIIYELNEPIRPWSLHYIQSATGCLYNLIGSVSRAPGMYKKIDPKSGHPLPEFLEDTNERVHPSVRVRLACEGLGLNDTDVWDCPSLLKFWRPQRVAQQFVDPVPRAADWGPPKSEPATTSHPPEEPGSSAANGATASMESLQMLSLDPSERWVWEYVGPEIVAPAVRTMVEENLGPYEQQLLALTTGKVHVYKYAESKDISESKAFHLPKFKKMMQDLDKKFRHLEEKAAQRARQNSSAQAEEEQNVHAVFHHPQGVEYGNETLIIENRQSIRRAGIPTANMLSILRKARLKDKEMRILMLGLDNAGKTTIVKKIMNEDVNTVSPTLGFIIKTIDYEGYKLNIWDVGGQKTLRSYWRNYFEKTDALIWVVDATDRLRIDDCRDELHGLLQEERLSGASLLIFANKTDVQGCMNEAEILQGLQLKMIRSHQWHVLRCSAMTGENLREGIAWVVEDAKARLFLY